MTCVRPLCLSSRPYTISSQESVRRVKCHLAVSRTKDPCARKASCDAPKAVVRCMIICHDIYLVVEISMWRGRCEGGSAVFCWRAQARMRVRRLGVILAMMLLLGLMPTPSTRADDAEVYRFGPGDRLRIAVLNDPAMSGEFTVQQSGGISLPSVGRIQVVGRGLDELQEEVVTRLRESGLIEPQISVEVAEYRPIYVVGDVKAPGSYPFRMGMTVLQTLAVAGGFLTLDDETLSLRLELLQAQELDGND